MLASASTTNVSRDRFPRRNLSHLRPSVTLVLAMVMVVACGPDPVVERMDASGQDAGQMDAPLIDAALRTDQRILEAGTDTSFDTTPAGDAGDDGATAGVQPPLGAASGGSGGGPAEGASRTTPEGQAYLLRVPSGYSDARPNALLLVYSGTEGGNAMMMNLRSAGPAVGIGDLIYAVLDGVSTRGDGAAGAAVLDDVRAHYNIDNDRTFLMSESAGTTAGLQLGLILRQSYFAAYWANDVIASIAPSMNAAALGFAPHGNSGPGGNTGDAQAIVDGMRAAGYRLPADAPYSGSGSGAHGSTDQFVAALQFFIGKTR